MGVAAFVVITIASFSAPSCEFNIDGVGGGVGGDDDCRAGVFLAAASGDLELTERLLGTGPPGTVNRDGRSPLFCAAFGTGPAPGRLAVARMLLDRGADPNRANAAGDTPLLWAADKGETEMVLLLLDRGADPNQTNTQSHTPLLRATYRKHAPAATLLLDRGADPNIAGTIDPFTEYLLLTGASLDGVAPGTATTGSVVAGSPAPGPTSTPVTVSTVPREASAAPVPSVAPPIGTTLVGRGYPPLVAAAANGDHAIVAALIQHHAIVNVVGGPGITPLYAAAQRGDQYIVGVLLLAGADPLFGVPPGGITPLAVANLGHHEAAAKLLADAEAAKLASPPR